MKKEEQGFTLVGILFVVLTLTIIGMAGYFVANHVSETNHPKSTPTNQSATIKGTVTIQGTLESAQSPGPDGGIVYVVKAPDGKTWSATNCGFINLPPATVDNVSPGDKVVVYGQTNKQEPYTINLCGSKSFYVKKQ